MATSQEDRIRYSKRIYYRVSKPKALRIQDAIEIAGGQCIRSTHLCEKLAWCKIWQMLEKGISNFIVMYQEDKNDSCTCKNYSTIERLLEDSGLPESVRCYAIDPLRSNYERYANVS